MATLKHLKIIAMILARGGSKGLPGKNIAPLAGKPLIAWTIEAASGCKLVDTVVVSSDSDDILDAARAHGATAIKRPKKLATDRVRPEPAMFHALARLRKDKGYVPDIVALLQPTSPLRDAQDVTSAIELMVRENADAVVSVTPIDNRLLKSFVPNEQGHLSHFTEAQFILMRRQDLPPVYHTNGAIYLVKHELFAKKGSLFPKRTLPFIMDQAKSHDVDTREDLATIERIMRSKKRDL